MAPPSSDPSPPGSREDPAVDEATDSIVGTTDPVNEAIDPVEAFALLGQEIRLGIVRALFAADPGASGDPVPFSGVAEAVGIRDAGHVYYHLDALCPHFVEHAEEGYRLRRPGRRVVRLLRSGSITCAADPDPMALPEDCVRCGGGLELRYDEGFASVVCPDCGRWFVRYRFPPGGLAGRDPASVAAALDARCREARRLGNRGVCPACSGSMGRRLATGSVDRFGHPANLHYECERCACAFDSTVGAALVGHPAVVSYLDDHGVDPRERPLWALPFAFDPGRVGFQRADPPGATLSIRRGGERLQVVVGLDGAVVATARTAAHDGGSPSARSSATRSDGPAAGGAIPQSPW